MTRAFSSLLLSVLLSLLLSLVLLPAAAVAQVGDVIDLAAQSAPGGDFLRAFGSAGSFRGIRGVPVAGGHDVDGDTEPDFAFSAFLASPLARNEAGEVYLIFGDGTAAGEIDTGMVDSRVLVIAGSAVTEHTGSEIWMDDVTGDGLGDLLIARQDFSLPGRIGAGGLSIVAGGPELAALAATGNPLDLAAIPAGITVTTLAGPGACNRLGMWVRTGDVTGDGIADVLVGADQEGLLSGPTLHRGAAYLLRGGSQLAMGGVVDLADFGTTALEGDIARIAPAAVDGRHSHFGATVQIGDLDGNGRGEVLIGVTLNRSGGGSEPETGCNPNHGRSDTTRDGTVVIAWDDNFTGDPWADGYTVTMDAAPGTTTRIDGNDDASNFGEEIIAGHDFDGDGAPDLFVGDIVGDQSANIPPCSVGGPGCITPRTNSGSGYVFYDAAGLAGLDFDMETGIPVGQVVSVIQGGAGTISSDTAAAGDFNGDGIDDLAVASPCAAPDGRTEAGQWDLLLGQNGPWPAAIDLTALPAPEDVFIVRVWGANATDVLGYSAAAGDIDGDGRADLISNEMKGDGVGPGQVDVGNLVILPATLLVPEPGPLANAAFTFAALAWLARKARRRASID